MELVGYRDWTRFPAAFIAITTHFASDELDPTSNVSSAGSIRSESDIFCVENRSSKPESRYRPSVITVGASSRYDDTLTLAIDVMVTTILILAEIGVIPRSGFEDDVAITTRGTLLVVSELVGHQSSPRLETRRLSASVWVCLLSVDFIDIFGWVVYAPHPFWGR
ncbi:hypothetical protein [Natrialba hulunbeirensis]|uniref:hypothetical protein n=1 Tax=Natrialba hulunbeirensis TaxID=123783 RepID=UPI00135F1BA7|nr:hypothetical protein [Natrialba hulunbeirensis]